MILQFPTHQINTRREITFIQARIAELKQHGDTIAERIKEIEQEALQGAQEYYQISTEALFLIARLEVLQESLNTRQPSPPLPYPIEQLELL